MNSIQEKPHTLTAQLETHGDWASPALLMLSRLLDAREWQGSLGEMLSKLTVEPDALGEESLRDSLRQCGLMSRMRKGSLAHIPETDLPTLAFFDDGEVALLREQTLDGWQVETRAGEKVTIEDGSRRLRWLEIQPKPLKAPARGQWYRELVDEYRGSFIAVGLLSLLNALLGLALPLFTMSVYDFLIPSGSIGGLVAVGIGALLALGWLLVSDRLRARVLSRTAAQLSYLSSRAVFSRILSTPAEFLMQGQSVQQIARVRDVDRIREFWGGLMAASMFDLPFIVVALTVIAIMGGPLVIVPILGALLYLLAGFYFDNRMAQAARESSRYGQWRQVQQKQLIEGLDIMRQGGSHTQWLQRYGTEAVRSARANYRYNMVAAAQQAVGRGLGMLIALATLMSGVFLVLNQALTAGGLIATMMLIWRVTGPLQMAFFSASRLKQFRQSVTQLNAVMDTPVEQSAEQEFANMPQEPASLAADRLVYRFSSVRDAALNGVSLAVDPGEKLAVVGPNGAGKSTLLACLAGLLKPQAGSVVLGGHDIRQFRHVDYRGAVVLLKRQVVLLGNTVREHLHAISPLGSEQEMIAVLSEAGLEEWLSRQSAGLDAPVRQQGQRCISFEVARGLALAGALLRGPHIFLLDDVLDTSDHPVSQAYRRLLKHPTCSVVFSTHDQSLMLQADKAAIMDRGTVAQMADLRASEETDADTKIGEMVE